MASARVHDTTRRSVSLLEETNASGAAQADYINFDGRPIATLDPSSGTLYFLHDDMLGTPQLATDASQTVAWQATYQPFGTASVSGTITQNLRLPGQYFDLESGWNHNGFRDYVPSLGRLVKPDPLALEGTSLFYNTRSGTNNLEGPIPSIAATGFYAYVGDDPINFLDPLGKAPIPASLLDRSRMLLSNQECGEFLKQLLLNLGLPPNLDALLKAFNETQFLPTPKNDPFVKTYGTGYTAHVDDVGASYVVHVSYPGRSNAAVTLLHEVFHTLNYGLTDSALAKATGYTGDPNDMPAASNYFSRQMEQHCIGCKK
ncbi:MAG: RHS repeat-associated core domain-containing protein [Terracidiphilus sp.]